MEERVALGEYGFSFLHISDLHERGPREAEAWRRRRVLGDEWGKNLDDLLRAQRGEPFDFVCFTGDAADWGLAEEYEKATEFFDSLLTKLGLGRDRLFLVPGNHDIHRDTNEATWRKFRKALEEVDPKGLAAWMAGGRPPFGFAESDRDSLLERQAFYRRWVNETLGREELRPGMPGRGNLGHRASIRLPGRPFEIHVIGLDSAWLAGDDADAKKLLLSDDQVMRLSTDDGRPLGGYRLALIHHPLTDLADGSAAHGLLSEHVDLLLRGHLHEPGLETWADPSQTLRAFAAGCLYEGHGADRYPNSCQAVRVKTNEQGRPLRYDVHFRGWSDRGFWADETKLYGDAPSGRLTIRLAPEAALPEPDARARDRFVGRAKEMRALEEALLQSPAPGAPACVLQGMPGVGKSYLADHFAAIHGSRFPGHSVKLVLDPARPAPQAEALLAELADRLEIRTPASELPTAVRARLLFPRTLLVVENVDSGEHAVAVVRLVSMLGGCAVLVTARLRNIAPDSGWKHVDVEPFDEPLALDQLRMELGDSSASRDEAALRTLVGTLGFLPLAIHLAAGYLRNHHTVESFLESLKEHGHSLPPADETELARADLARRVLSTTFQLSLELLEKKLGTNGEAGLSGLRRLALAPASGFGRSYGAALSGLTPSRFDLLAAEAWRLSLLMEVRQPARWSGDRCLIHPLLAEMLGARLTRAETVAARDATAEWFLSRFPGWDDEDQGQRAGEVLEESAALAAWLMQIPIPELGRVEGRASWFAMTRGPFHVWMSFLQRARRTCANVSIKSNTLFTLAYVAKSAGDLDISLAAANEKASIDKNRGDEQGHALARGAVADIHEARGEPEEALRIRREEALPVYERLGDVRSRAITMGQIADILQARGELEEALRVSREEALPVLERLGSTRWCALTRGRIASVLLAQGQADEAIRIRSDEELPVYRSLGLLPDLVRGQKALGLALIQRDRSGDQPEAVRLLHEALAAAEKMKLKEAPEIRTILQDKGLPLP